MTLIEYVVNKEPVGGTQLSIGRGENCQLIIWDNASIRDIQPARKGHKDYVLNPTFKCYRNIENMTYVGCPKCNKKITENRLTGHYCQHCMKVVAPPEYFYFIHALFQDFTG